MSVISWLTRECCTAPCPTCMSCCRQHRGRSCRRFGADPSCVTNCASPASTSETVKLPVRRAIGPSLAAPAKAAGFKNPVAGQLSVVVDLAAVISWPHLEDQKSRDAIRWLRKSTGPPKPRWSMDDATSFVAQTAARKTTRRGKKKHRGYASLCEVNGQALVLAAALPRRRIECPFPHLTISNNGPSFYMSWPLDS